MSWQLAISAMILGIMALFFLISLIFREKEHIALKLFFLFVAIYISFLGINYALQLAIDNSSSTAVKNTIISIHQLNIYVLFGFTGYFIFYYIYRLIIYTRNYVK